MILEEGLYYYYASLKETACTHKSTALENKTTDTVHIHTTPSIPYSKVPSQEESIKTLPLTFMTETNRHQ